MMDEQTRRDYERAAVALETHERLGSADNSTGWKAVAWAAWDQLNRTEKGTTRDVDIAAARLLRECIRTGTVLK